MKFSARPSQAAQPSTREIPDRVSWPARCRPTETMPVAMTAAPAAGGRPAHQARRAEVPDDMAPMLESGAAQAGCTTLWIDDSPS
ncbi:hypothetical protein GCM10010240_28680 [Streptomyces griseoviridis]|nr:hypothetical protein GCM10010240_28680 [Streptomyces griseoviridis]